MQMHVNIPYQKKITPHNYYPPEQTRFISELYHLSLKITIYQSILIINVTQIHYTVIHLSVTLNQSVHCTERTPSDLMLCTQHPSHEEQSSHIIMHLHRMIDCPDHTDSYIKQQLATR